MNIAIIETFSLGKTSAFSSYIELRFILPTIINEILNILKAIFTSLTFYIHTL